MVLANYIFTFLLAVINFHSRNAHVLEKVRIMAGNETQPGEIKYVVAILIEKSEYSCGGGIIANKFILSAGHCFVDKYNDFRNFSNIKIVAGTNDLMNDQDQWRVKVDVEKIYIPDSYNFFNISHDIAVLKLKQSLDLKNNNNLQKLALPSRTRKYANVHAVIAGFGWDELNYTVYRTGEIHEFGSDDGKLKSANVITFNNTKCKKNHFKIIDDSHLCAKVVKHKTARRYGVCHGDSGSPLVIESKTVIGVVSWSIGCDETVRPMIYTRVSYYIDFIKNARKDNTYKMLYKQFG